MNSFLNYIYLGKPQPPMNNENDDGVSDWLFVARINLKIPIFGFNPIGGRVIKHSGILIRKNQQYYLIDYHGDSQVQIQNVPNNNVGLDSFDCDGQWSKQTIGKRINSAISLKQIQQIMQNLMDLDGEYDVLTNCCHIAQESVRYFLGLAELDSLTYKDIVKKKVDAYKNQ